jgi:hypothetical protein
MSKLISIIQNGWEMFINTDHIIRVEYYPPIAVENDESEERDLIDRPASMDIFMDEVKPYRDEGYDGKFLGMSVENKVIHLKGNRAEIMRDVLAREAYVIST